MPKKVKPIVTNIAYTSDITLSNFLLLIKSFYFKPLDYPQRTPLSSDILFSILFFVFNLSIGAFVFILRSFYTHRNTTLTLLEINQIAIYLPIVTFLFLVISTIFHLLAKIFGGKARLSQSILATALTSPALLVLSLPYIWTIGVVLGLYDLISSFYFIHRYAKIYAVLTILLPIGIGLFIKTLLFLE